MFLRVMLILWLYFLSFIYFQLFFLYYHRRIQNQQHFTKRYILDVSQGSKHASVIVRALEPQYSKTKNTNDNFPEKLYKVLVKRDFRKGLKVFIVDFVGIINFNSNNKRPFTLDQGFDSLLTTENFQSKNTPCERL